MTLTTREAAVNETFRELKERMRRLDDLLVARGLGNMEFAQAVSRLRRAARHGDRSREPSVELRVLLERAELLARSIA
jgi:GTPase involved in cell partitioning and DNA repair